VFLKLRGLDENKRYRLEETGEIYYGKTLMSAGIRFSLGSNSGKSKIMIFRAVE
jgi:alpha-galactosidase